LLRDVNAHGVLQHPQWAINAAFAISHVIFQHALQPLRIPSVG